MFTALVASAAHLLYVTTGLQGITFPLIVLVNVQRVNLSVILAPVLYCLPYPLLPLLNCILLTVFPLNPITSLGAQSLFSQVLDLLDLQHSLFISSWLSEYKNLL